MKTLFTLIAAAFIILSSPAAGAAQPDDKDYAGYLFTYFTGNSMDGEQIRFAVSNDGCHYKALNDNRPVLDSRIISSTGGVRDPHILRGADGETFYMVVTDMVSGNGWDSNRAMVLLRSRDLVNWEHSVVNIQKRYPGQADLRRVWAPQTIYDNEAGKYMIYWSMKHGDGPDIIYCAYANEDFTDLESDYRPLFVPSDGRSCIDGDIVFHDGLYHLFYKTEGHGNGIKVATTPSLTSGEWTEYPDYKQQTTESVEGSGIFKLIGEDRYILMYDVYMKGQYQFTESADLNDFRIIDSDISMNFKPRHGTVVAITRDEMRRLLERWPSADLDGIHVDVNPVIPGFHADPEIMYSRRDGRYYLYSTTDGTPGWGGTYYTCYSSPDLTHWTPEGTVLDLATDQVGWADGNCWAPAIEEKVIDGRYRYFLYFSGNPVKGGGKQIGVAVSDNPTGPFVDLGHPIVTESPAGKGQQIDVDVFTDPLSGKSYLYWGAELTPDMTSVVDSTITVMTPEGGTLRTWAYREAPYVFYDNGRYYFMWSVDDTGSPNYHVAYGTSDKPLGPITVARQPVILQQDPDRKIYGTAHNSVVRVPATGDWRIVYHRINENYLDNAPGIHREVCIDRMTIGPDGSINPVVPAR